MGGEFEKCSNGTDDMSRVILLGGLLTAGKDEVADHLVTHYGFKKLGMSDTLAEALYVLNPVIDWDYVTGHHVRYRTVVDRVGYVEAKRNPEVRRLLQTLGTEVVRNMLGENLWVEATAKKISSLLPWNDVVLTGVRFPNELVLREKFEGVAVWVDRPGLSTGDHSSEALLRPEEFNYVLDNSGTLEDLYRATDALLDRITRGEG